MMIERGAGNDGAEEEVGRELRECQPGVSPPAKSSPTTLCTEMTIGAMIAAMIA